MHISEGTFSHIEALISMLTPTGSATFFCEIDHEIFSKVILNIFYGHSLPSTDSRRAVVSFWQKNVHNTG